MSKKHKQSESNDDLSSLQAFNIFDRYKHNGYPDDGTSTFVDERERDPQSTRLIPHTVLVLTTPFQILSAWTDHSEKKLHNCSKTAAEWDRS